MVIAPLIKNEEIFPGHLLEGKTVLLTGSGGYIASGITAAMSQIDCKLVRLSRRAGSLRTVEGLLKTEDIEVDIVEGCDWNRLLDGIDIVFHLAAQTSVSKADEDPAGDFECNVLPLLNMLLSCKKDGYRPVVVFAGTATEIGLSRCLPVSEHHYDEPITIYDIHKLTAEKYLKYFVGEGVVRGCVLRLANVYGPGPQSSSADRGILNLMVRRAIKGEDLTVYGKDDHIRDYIYIDDVVRAFLRAAVHIDRIDGRHFPLGSGKGHTIFEAFSMVAEKVAKKTGKLVDVIRVTPPAGLSPIEKRSFFADVREFSDCTNWQPRFSLNEGIEHTIDSFLSQREDE